MQKKYYDIHNKQMLLEYVQLEEKEKVAMVIFVTATITNL